MSEAAATPEGQTIEGRYRVIRRIAEGGMATVYEAVDERLERTVAIKIMHTQLAQGAHRAQFVERFRREAKSAASIANPHIVQVYDTGEFNGLDYLVMEYVHGVNLRHDMNLQGTFSVRETLRVISETLDGLAAAHRVGVVHRDIKPENILLNDRGHVQITDFGLAKAASQATLSSTGMLLGTAAYLAPEMIENNQATKQGDLYSVGIMAWEMLAGDVPFTSDNPVTMVFKHVHEDVPSVATVCPGIDPRVAAFIAHLTARAVNDRPADAADALHELQQFTPQLDMAAWQYRKLPDDARQDAHESTVPALVGTIPAPPAPPATQVLPNTVPDTVPDTAGSEENGSTTAAGATPVPSTPGAAVTTPLAPVPPVQNTPVVTDQTATQVITSQPGSTTQSIDLAAVSDPDMPSSPSHNLPFPTISAQNMPHSAQHNAQVDRPRKSHKALIITLVVALVVALCAGGGGGAWWYYLGPGSYWTVPQPTDVTCVQGEACSTAGASWSTYKSTLNVANIPFKVSQQYSDDVAQGAIITTSPKNVGDHISKRNNDHLSVVVSRGVKPATVPSDIDDPNSANGKDPLAALQAAGFTNVTRDESQEQYSQTLPEGTLQSISVEPGATLPHNEKITVVLSKGPMPVAMPDVVGKTQDEAMAALNEAKLKVTTSEAYDDKVPAGSVVSASVNAGSQLHWGDAVSLVISKGPEMANVPNVVGQNKDAATKTLQALGFDVKTTGLNILGLVQQQSATGQTRLRDENGKKTVITLTVV
ncbi:serine/threonine protein kinase [Bifidobacterium goeldii]|uniref:non-specific serine/threonine protein kinase n=1 Tax=Bifidobacterium goeldii TaxID=2306975 RepID=A0A430FMW3_9BIFI|nr:Stk1 family PASTA domain-containing Ser/Thr kinase [Bifidobacterium goeldii]RSX54170.1 serine/threonine protein kinase [Bifidobacterium goeldii]